MLRSLVVIQFALVPLSLAAVGGLVGRTQSSGARGVLLCNGRPLPDVLVKLYDDDRGIDMDDLMATTRSDSNGRFELQGSNAEFTPIDPKINIYHDCNDGWWPCQRKISIMLPDGYITEGSVANKIYDAGAIELSGEFSGETRDCLH